MDDKYGSVTYISGTLTRLLQPLGFECYEFKVGWYNDQVEKLFHLQYDRDTLAFIILSIPDMFENAFKPFIKSKQYDGLKDPIDECCAHYFQKTCQAFPNYNIDIIHDFELHPHRRPKVLVQTAGHVSGAVYFYQKQNVKSSPWPKNQKIYGVCIHPEYGGWFALRGVLIFKGVLCPNLPQKVPPDIVASEEKKILLLNLFNFHWQDWTFRDIIPVKQKYSEEQKTYFSTEPSRRWTLLGIKRSKEESLD